MMYRGVKTACRLLAVVLFAAGGVLIFVPHEYLLIRLVDLFHLSHKHQIIRAAVSSVKIYGAGFVCLAAGVVLWLPATGQFFSHRLSAMLDFFRYGRGRCIAIFTGLSRPQKLLLAGAVMVMALLRICLAARLHVHIDEAFTYVYLVSKGPVFSALYYPGPNNHLFFSILAATVDLISPSPLLSLRSISIVASLLTGTLFFLYFFPKNGFTFSLVLMLTVSVSPHFLFYSVQGRGYMLQTLLLSVLCVVMPYAAARRAGAAEWMVLLSALAFFTLPTQLYFHTSLIIISLSIVYKNKKDFLRIAGIFTAGAVVAGLLYLPALLVNGSGAFTDNSWVQAQATDFTGELFLKLVEYAAWLWTDLNPELWITLVLIFISLLSFRKRTGELFYIKALPAALLISFLIVACVTQKLPFNRVFVPVIPVFIALLLLTVNKLIKSKPAFVLVASAAVVFFLFRFSATYMPSPPSFYGSVSRAEETVASMKPKTVYAENDVYRVCMRFLLMERKITEVKIAENEEIDEASLLILEKTTPVNTHIMLPLYEDDFCKVYTRKK